jgi:hypothetical protein
MLAEAVEIEPDLIGELDLLQQIPQALCGRLEGAVVEEIRSVLSEGIEADFHGQFLNVTDR